MTLARKLTLQLAAIVVAVALIAAGSLAGLYQLAERAQRVQTRHAQLRAVYEVGHFAATARLLLRTDATAALIDEQRFRAGSEFRRLAQLTPPDDALHSAFDDAYRAWADAAERDDAPKEAMFNSALSDVARLAGQINQAIDADRAAIEARLTITITIVAGLGAVTLIAAAFIGVAQYRAVMRPLRAFDAGMMRVADANFTQRLEPASEDEFARLAERFNRMADRLDSLYRTLEDEVNTKSRALVRSERLAGVGYLAAGLAHEINNPLGIIGGYAEAALAKPGDTERAARALRVIADEAFRCKQITGKLLSLARPTDADPTEVDLAPVIEQAVELMRGLDAFAGHTIDTDLADDLVVTGHASELTQVMINLLANALEATPAGGRVAVSTERRGPWALLTVTDSGRGMSSERIERVFEPFYTDSPQRDREGTGLGLAVTHAIVTQHGGRISAASPGENAGSTFTVELPIAKTVDANA